MHRYHVTLLFRHNRNATGRSVFTRGLGFKGFSSLGSRANQPYVRPMSRDVLLAESSSQLKLLYSPNTQEPASTSATTSKH